MSELAAADDQELFTSRVLGATSNEVFAALSDSARLARWWGPEGFTTTTTQFDFRPGGQWHYTMHGPNGANFVNTSEFVELVEGERFVMDHVSPPEFRLTAYLCYSASEPSEPLKLALESIRRVVASGA